jgi:PAS domain S-box-containing protein
MCSIFGIEPRQFNGQLSFFLDRVYPKDLPYVQTAFEALLAGSIDTVEFRIVRPDGSVRIIAGNGQRVFDSDGTVVGVMGINRDITELRNLEGNLQHQVRKLEAIVSSIGEIVYEHRLDDDSVFCVGVECLGYSPATFGTTFSDWLAHVHVDDLPLVIDSHQKLCIIGANASEIRYRFKVANGTYRWVSDRGIPLYEKGELTSIVGILRDQQEDVEREAAREAARDLENRITRNKIHFLSSMNHELRTPMHGVLGFLDLLANSELNETQRSQVNTAKRCANSLFSLLNGLMEFTKLDATPLALLREKLSVSTLFDDCIAFAQLEVAQQSLAVEKLVAPEVPPTIIGDAPKIRQILGHLLGNAIRAAPKASIVRIQAGVRQDENKRLILSITDSGPGIPASDVEAATSVIEKGRPTPRSSMSHLGLAIASRLIEAMSGELIVENGDTSGLTVSIVLPLEVPTQDLPVAKEDLRVLLVEHTDWSRDFLEDCLRQANIAVDAAADASEARTLFRPSHHNTVLIDTGLADSTYLDLLSELRDLTPTKKLRVIALGTRQPADTALSSPPLVTMYLDRPIAKDLLLGLLLPPA